MGPDLTQWKPKKILLIGMDIIGPHHDSDEPEDHYWSTGQPKIGIAIGWEAVMARYPGVEWRIWPKESALYPNTVSILEKNIVKPFTGTV